MEFINKRYYQVFVAEAINFGHRNCAICIRKRAIKGPHEFWLLILQESCKTDVNLARFSQADVNLARSCKILARFLQDLARLTSDSDSGNYA